MKERRFAGAICSPARIRVEGGVTRNVQHDRWPPLARRTGQRAQEGLGQTERTEHIRGEGSLEVLALGVRQELK